MEERQQRVLDKGVVDMVTWDFDGIKMGHAVSRFTEPVSWSGSNQNDVVRLHFGLRGNYSFSYKQLNQDYDLIGGHHNIMYSNTFDITVQNRTLEVETFGVQYPRELFIEYTQHADDLLKRFAEHVIDGRSVMLSDYWGALEPPIQTAIQQVLNCSYGGDIKRLFFLSKSLELLALSVESCMRSMNRKAVFIKTKADKEKIIAVKDLITERLHNPPSFPEIARMVGLNEYKLKRGFKEVFNTTVFGYLADQRLQLAHRYLLDTDKTAAEVAHELGYATPQHFNNAFKKKFGVTPFSVRNNP